MQTLQIEVSEDKLELFLTIIGNLKDDIVKSITLPNKPNDLNIEAIEKNKVPNNETLESIKEVKNGDVVHYDSVEDMMKDLKS